MINEQIRDREVRVIDDEGNQLGIMSARDAQKIAREKNLDLVKIAPKAKPPVCKIIDYGKFRYEQAKKDKENKKKQSPLKKAPLPQWPERRATTKLFYALKLEPKKNEMRKVVNAITLYVDPEDFFPRAIEQHEPTEDWTILVMEDIRINWPFPPDTFRITCSPGTKRTELRVGSFIRSGRR